MSKTNIDSVIGIRGIIYSDLDRVYHIESFNLEKEKNPRLLMSTYARDNNISPNTFRGWINYYNTYKLIKRKSTIIKKYTEEQKSNFIKLFFEKYSKITAPSIKEFGQIHNIHYNTLKAWLYGSLLDDNGKLKYQTYYQTKLNNKKRKTEALNYNEDVFTVNKHAKNNTNS